MKLFSEMTNVQRRRLLDKMAERVEKFIPVDASGIIIVHPNDEDSEGAHCVYSIDDPMVVVDWLRTLASSIEQRHVESN